MACQERDIDTLITDGIACVALAFALSFLGGCGGGDAPIDSLVQQAPGGFVTDVTHAYFPLVRGTEWTYEGTRDGVPRREEAQVLDLQRRIAGVACTGLQEVVFENGAQIAGSTEWYAEDLEGAVWKFGESSYELGSDGQVSKAEAWHAGASARLPWQILAAKPRTGDQWVGGSADAPERGAVASVHATVTVGIGTFTDCLELIENPDDPNDSDIILYAIGVGRVAESNGEGGAQLVEIKRR